ncbi:MAG: hypothetical protein Q9213_002896 [Squamulea squamosa]
MTDQLLISLRPWPSDDKTTESLPYLIARINEQRGSFRSITEASLEEEIRAAETTEHGSPANNYDDVEDSQDSKAKGEELAGAREEIIKRVGEAYNTSSQALDLVSLLLTGHVPKVAEATVSPYVRQAIPFGSLGAEVMQVTQDAGSDEVSEDLVSLGWRMRSLTRSADSLLTSATRLEQEVERETTYWLQVLAIKAAGWPVCRLPGDRHALAVRFGFAEAHADFRDRGIAVLRRNEDGSVELDYGQRWDGEKRLSVCVVKDGRTLATSKEQPAATDDNKSLAQRLTRARNSLFDEEIYHELNREARNLVNQEVRCVGDNVCFPYDGDSQIEISLMDVAEESPLDVSSIDKTTPAAIAMALRLLLSHAHRQNLQRRSQPPLPITDASITRPLYSLLRPILEIIQHQSMRKSLQAELSGLGVALSSAGLTMSVEEVFSSLSWNRSIDDLPNDFSITESLIKRLILPRHSQVALRLPQQTNLKLDIYTSVFPPTFGTSFQLTTLSTAAESALADMPAVLHFTTIKKLREHIWYITALDIISAFRAWPKGSLWIMPSRYQAALERKAASSVRKDRLSVYVDQEGFKAFWQCNGRTGSRLWKFGSRADEGVPSLVEVVKDHL